MRTETLIKQMSNKELVATINKIRKEKEHPETYGKYGTSKWVTSSEFWQGYHGNLKQELIKRKKQGKIKAQAGSPLKNAIKQKMGYSMEEIMRM